MPKLILLRHGQSQFNQDSRFCGWINAPLTDTGIEQAINTAFLIKTNDLTKDIPIHLLVTSRLQRAVKTADIILENLDRLDMDIIKSWRLNERHYGSLQGLRKNEILKKYGEEKFMYWRRAYNGCPPPSELDNEFYKDTLKIAEFDDDLLKNPTLIPRCESLKMVIDRLKPFWETEILNSIKNNKNVLCVTHGSVVRALLTILYDLSADDVKHLNIPNGIPILIDISDETGEPKSGKWVYLEPEKAKIEAEKVRHDGFLK
jgi:2,3-bisphosphoglycerate-dependent phosphoglycerate mutase